MCQMSWSWSWSWSLSGLKGRSFYVKSKNPWLSEWLSEWVSQWQGHLLSCQVTAKKRRQCFQKWNLVLRTWGQKLFNGEKKDFWMKKGTKKGPFQQFGPKKDQVLNSGPFCKHWMQRMDWQVAFVSLHPPPQHCPCSESSRRQPQRLRCLESPRVRLAEERWPLALLCFEPTIPSTARAPPLGKTAAAFHPFDSSPAAHDSVIHCTMGKLKKMAESGQL